jgi:peptide-methionine (S)-S-oxide reductase
MEETMRRFARFAAVLIAALALGAAPVFAADSMKIAAIPALEPGEQRAMFSMGCFWSAQAAFEGLPGVRAVISGFTGGTVANPTYEQVSGEGTGHAETILVIYDPKKIGYAQLLDYFWHNIDPTQAEGQFCDEGHQYRSAIWFENDEQRRLARESKRKLETTPQRFKGRIVTAIAPAGPFYAAEEYHQGFYRTHAVHYHLYRVGCRHDARLIELWGKPGRENKV